MTVEDLIRRLKEMPQLAEVVTCGPDCGGYDCITGTNVELQIRRNHVFIFHNDGENFNWGINYDES